MGVRVVPISKAYRENYDKIFKKVVKEPKRCAECVKVYPAVGWAIPLRNEGWGEATEG